MNRAIRLKIGLILVSLILLYQNCAPNKVRFLSSLGRQMESGNGGGYSGKPDGTFYRFVPGFSCNGQEEPKAVLTMNAPGDFSYRENSSLACGLVDGPLPKENVTRSRIQDQVVSYQAIPFERKDATPTGIPANLFEAWCRDLAPDALFEVHTHFDRVALKARAKIFEGSERDGQIQVTESPEFDVARLVTPTRVLLRADGFELVIDRSRFSPVVGEFIGELTRSEGKKTLSCALGGSLDPRIWPAEQISDFPLLPYNKNLVFAYGDFELSPDRQTLAVRTGLGPRPSVGAVPSGARSLLVWQAASASWHRLTSLDTGARGVSSFQFTPDSSRLVVTADPPPLTATRLLSVDTKGEQIIQLHQRQSHALVAAPDDFFVDPDSSEVYFRDFQDSFPNNAKPGLWRTSSMGGTPTLLQDARTLGPNTELISFRYFPEFRSTVFCVLHLDPTKTIHSAYLLQPLTTSPSLLAPPLPENAKYMYCPQDFLSSTPRFLVHSFYSSETKKPSDASGSNTYLFDLRENLHVNLGLVTSGSSVQWNSGDWLLISWNPWSSSNPTETSLLRNLNFKMHRLLNPARNVQREFQSLPSVISLTPDGSAIWYVPEGLRPSLNANRIVRLDTETLTDGEEICPLPNHRWTGFIPVHAQHPLGSGILGVGINTTTWATLDFYWIRTNGTCEKRNEVAALWDLRKLMGTALKLAPARNAALLYLSPDRSQVQMTDIEQPARSLIHIPLDGAPAVQITAPRFASASLNRFEFLGDGDAVVYLGDQEWPGINQLYIWRPRVSTGP